MKAPKAVRQVAGLLLIAFLVQGCGSPPAKKAGGHPAQPKHKVKAKAKVGSTTAAFTGSLPPLDAVQFLSQQVGFVAGQGIVLETTDGGKTWLRVYDGQAQITALDIVDQSQGYAVTATGQLLSWSQGSWQPLSGLPGAVAAVAPQGQAPQELLTTQGALYRQSGSGWQLDSVKDVVAMAFPGQGTGYAVSESSGAAPQVFASADGGATWQKSFSPAVSPPRNWSTALEASGGSAWLLLTSNSGQSEHQPYVAYSTGDSGQHWQEALAGPLFASQGMYPQAPSSLYGLQAGPIAVTGQTAYFVSWRPDSPQNVTALTSTSDGGQTFSQQPLLQVAHSATPDFFRPLGIFALPGGTVWLAGSRGGVGKLIESQDGGQSWQVPAF